MTPASSDRYQSRLFRFVYKQSRRFTQQCDRAWRNLQFTASWVASVGLYPLFLLFQSSRSTANQVHQAVEETLRQLPADEADIQEESPTVDTPIRQVLLYVKGAGQEDEIRGQGRLGGRCADVQVCRYATTNYQLPITTHSIRGIASQLSSRSLVLVTAQNQTLDVLDPQQQDSLQEEIMTAVAQYWQYRRSRNQFLAPNPQPLAPSPWLTSLDHTVAEVESHHLVRVKSAAIAFYQSIFPQRINLSRSDRVTSKVRVEESSKTHTTRILSLIWAAIDYFFGTDDAVPPMPLGTSQNEVNSRLAGTISTKQFTTTRPTAQLPTTANLTDEDLEDPWLSANDLFGSVAQEASDRSIAVALPANPAADYALPQRGGLRQFLSKTRAPKGIVKQQRTAVDPPKQSTPQISRLQKGIGEKISPPLSSSVGGIGSRAKSTEVSITAKGKQTLQKAETNFISTSASKTSSVQPTPDWIETPATLMGYVKHPLEQILAWLDRAMLWLEESLVKFWQWMQKIWRKL